MSKYKQFNSFWPELTTVHTYREKEMSDLGFFKAKFSVFDAFNYYYKDLKNLYYPSIPNNDKQKLTRYLNAFNCLKNCSRLDLLMFALSYGRHSAPNVQKLTRAFPIILARESAVSSNIDWSYLLLLQSYAQLLDQYRDNIKQWTIRFLVTSERSPVKKYFDRELKFLLSELEEKIESYESAS